MADSQLSICMVTTFYPPLNFGGDGASVRRLTAALAGRGHKVTVVHSADAFRSLGGEARETAEGVDGVEVHSLHRRAPRATAFASYVTGRPALYARELRAVLDEQDFDVIHFHNVSLVGGPDVLRYGRGVKLYTTHEHWLVCPMHVLFRDNREPCVEPHCLRCTLRFRRPPQLWRYTGLLERSLANVDLFLAPSQFTIDAHRSRGFKGPMRKLSPFLAASEVGASAESFDNDGRPYFLFVGRLERLKGVQVLIDAFRTYSDAELIIAGEGAYGEELRRLAAGLAHVRFVGHVQGDALDALYRGAFALVVPSVGYEAFGTVVVEAMARRTPVIVHRLGALPELIADAGGAGLVYATPAELVTAMRRLAGDDSLRTELGDKGHAAWQRLWTEERHLDGYFEAIDEAQSRRA